MCSLGDGALMLMFTLLMLLLLLVRGCGLPVVLPGGRSSLVDVHVVNVVVASSRVWTTCCAPWGTELSS